MADRSVRVVLTAATTQFQAAFSQAANATKAFSDKSESYLRRNRDSIEKAAGAATLLGAAIVGGVGLAVKTFADFDQAMSNVAATGADARQNLDALRATAVTAGREMGFSAKESAEGMEALLKAGVSAKDVLGGALTGALSLAAAGQMSVADAAETAATAMTQFKLSGKDVPHIADLLAAGAGKAQGDVSDLVQALKQGGLVASQFGISIEETTGTLSAFASAGLLGSDAGTSFRTMLLRLANPAGQSATLMKKLGIETYNAQGQFIGIAGLANQLQTKLGGLSDAQRQAALATIFGTDAIRAASILYDQGAEGIQNWTKQVNDAGFAAEVARIRQDNLAGDLKKLKTAIDALFINGGSGLNTAMRDVTQNLTNLTDAIGRMPKSEIERGLGMAAVAGGALLVAGGLGKAVVSINDTRDALAKLAPEGSKAAKALGGVRSAAGALAGIAAIVATVSLAFNVLDQQFGTATKSVEQLTTALELTSRNAKAGLGDLDKMFTFRAAGARVDEVKGLGDALSQIANADWATKTNAAVNKWLNLPDSFNKITDQVASLDQALSRMDASQAAAAFQTIADKAAASGVSMDQLITLFPQYADQMRRIAIEATGADVSNEQLADMMKGKMPAAIKAAAAASPELAEKLQGLGVQSTEAKTSLDDLVTSMFAAANAALDLSNTEVGYGNAVERTRKTIEENSKTLKTAKKGSREYNQAVRDNEAALNDQATAALRNISAAVKNGDSTAKVTKITKQARDEFVAAAIAAGKTAKEANNLADKYGLIPSDVATQVSAPGADRAYGSVDTLVRRVNDLPPEQRTEFRALIDKGDWDAVNRKLNELAKERFAKINVTYTGGGRATGGNRTGANASAYADGGQVGGYSPHPKADNILTALTAREWVHPVSSVDYYGPRIMSMLQHRQIPREALRFADGGQVGVTTRSYAPAPMAPSLSASDLARVLSAVAPSRTLNIGQVGADARQVGRQIFAEWDRHELVAEYRSNRIGV